MSRFRLLCYLCLFLVPLTVSAAQQTAHAVINIGVLAYDGKSQSLQRWQPTIHYLSRLIPGYSFRLQALTHQEMVHAINKGVLDFILTNPGYYVQLEAQAGATRIAMFKTAFQGQPLTRFGAVIFTRADSDIKTPADLKQRSFAAVSENAFGGFLLARRELLNHGVGQQDLRPTWLGFPQSDIVRQVLAGKVDAGTVRSGILEQLVLSGAVDLSALRILGQKRNASFPLLHSTALYPEWPFASLPYTDAGLSEQVAIALLQMPAQSPAAQQSGGAGWTIPMDYSVVHEMMRTLNVAPYQQDTEPPSFWSDYWYWLMAGLFMFLLSLLAIVLISRTNRELKQSRTRLLQEINERQNIEKLLVNQRNELDQMLASRTEALQRSNEELQNEIALMSRFAQKMSDLEATGGSVQEAGQFPDSSVRRLPAGDESLQQRFAGVTPRELEILKLLAHGESNKSIANLLHISPKTVELHRANLISKTGSSSSTDLVRMAVLTGLIQ